MHHLVALNKHIKKRKPFGGFEAADEEFVLCCGNDKLFETFCTEVLGQPEVFLDERFHTAVARKKYELEVKELVESWSKQRSAAENVRILSECGIPASEILTIDRVRHDPHIAGTLTSFPY